MLASMWKRADFAQAGAAFMTLKVLLGFSGLYHFPPIVDNILLCLALLFFALSFLQSGIPHIKKLILPAILGIVAFYTCVVIDDSSILITLISLCVLRYCNVRRFFEAVLWVTLWFCAIHMVAAVLISILVIPDPFVLISRDHLRFTFGFVHSNSFSALTISAMMLFLWLYGENHFWEKICISAVVLFLIFMCTYSRTAILVGMICLAMLAFARWKPPVKVLRIVLRVIIPTLSIFMLLMMILYLRQNWFALKVNSMINNRVLLGAAAYEHMGLSLFGQFIPFVEEMMPTLLEGLDAFTFDNCYTYFWVQGGIFWLLVLSWGFFRAAPRLTPTDSVLLIAWALYAMCENTALNGYLMFPIFLISQTWEDVKLPAFLSRIQKPKR